MQLVGGEGRDFSCPVLEIEKKYQIFWEKNTLIVSINGLNFSFKIFRKKNLIFFSLQGISFNEIFIKKPFFQETFPAQKNFWLRARNGSSDMCTKNNYFKVLSQGGLIIFSTEIGFRYPIKNYQGKWCYFHSFSLFQF